MKRLVAFGCSNTYGHGLEDCCLPDLSPGLTPSKLAWPAVLAGLLDLQLLNKGKPGASNKLIWKTIIDTDLNKDDIVVIIWSYINRWSIFNQDENNLEINHWNTEKRSKNYYKFYYSEYDLTIDFYNRCNFVQYYLKEKNILNYHIILKPTKVIPNWNNVNFEFDLTKYQSWPTAKDKLHFGSESHNDIANRLFNIINAGMV
jgi:hypothetical protein